MLSGPQCDQMAKLFVQYLAINKNETLPNKALVWWFMGEDSCPEGCGFDSQHCLLEGHFSHIFVIKIVTFV